MTESGHESGQSVPQSVQIDTLAGLARKLCAEQNHHKLYCECEAQDRRNDGMARAHSNGFLAGIEAAAKVLENGHAEEGHGHKTDYCYGRAAKIRALLPGVQG